MAFPKLRFVTLGALWLALLWGALLWDLQRHVDELYANTRRELVSTAQVGAQALASTVRSIDLVLVDLREHWQANAGDFDAKVATRDREVDLGVPFAIAVLSPDGRLLFSSANPAAKGRDMPTRPYDARFRASHDDDLAIAGPFDGVVVARRIIHFARPIRLPDGELAGVIVMAVEPRHVSNVLQSIDYGENTVVTLVRDDGGIVARARLKASPQDARLVPTVDIPESALGGGPVPWPMSRYGLPEHGGFARLASPIDGIERLVAWRRVDPYPLTLLIGQPASVADGIASTLRWRYRAVGALGSAMVLAIVYWRWARSRARAEAAARQEAHLAALERSAAELRDSRERLHRLAVHQMASKEEERKLVAKEIHDELGQRLTVLRMDVATLPRTVAGNPAGLDGRVAELKDGIDGIVAVVRDIAGRLRPPALDVGVGAAVEALVEEFETRLRIPCEFDNRLPAGLVVDDLRATALFRIAQESLTNVARHAAARRVRVALDVVDGDLHLEVQDDGVGFDPELPPHVPSFGLSGMHERADMLGGTLNVVSSPGAGTTVDVRIPIDGAPVAGGTAADTPAASKESA